jgi:hypothetical protein
MVTALVVVAAVLATLAGVLTVLLLRPGNQAAPPPQSPPRPPQVPPGPPVRALDAELHEAAARFGEPPRPTAPSPRAAPAVKAVDGGSGVRELEVLLAQALETACAIPGADAAIVAVTLGREPIVGTLGLARHEADRLASTLPTTQRQTRSIEIAYEYEGEERYDTSAGRIERGIAVPVPGPTPALIAILTRAPAAALGAPQLALLEEVSRRLAPALAAVDEVQATRRPVSITVREVDGVPPPGSLAAEREPRQIDWFHAR